jgi:hypothetical protein
VTENYWVLESINGTNRPIYAFKYIKLNDILRLDKRLKRKGRLLAVGWKAREIAAELTRGTSKSANKRMSIARWSEQDFRMARPFIAISRWLQVESPPGDTAWINDLRQQLKTILVAKK